MNKLNNITKMLNDFKEESDTNSNSNRKSYLNKNDKIANETFLTASKNFNPEENLNNISLRKSHINTEEKLVNLFENDYEK